MTNLDCGHIIVERPGAKVGTKASPRSSWFTFTSSVAAFQLLLLQSQQTSRPQANHVEGELGQQVDRVGRGNM